MQNWPRVPSSSSSVASIEVGVKESMMPWCIDEGGVGEASGPVYHAATITFFPLLALWHGVS